MKKAWSDVKSFVTVLMTIAMVILLFAPIEVNKEVLTIFIMSVSLKVQLKDRRKKRWQK